MRYSGDDFSYLMHFGYADGAPGHFAGISGFPKFIISHWLDQNGRIANYLAAVMLRTLPESINMLLNGVAVTVMMWLVLQWAGIGRRRFGAAAALLLIALMVFALPWWDSMQVFDCSVNYVWSTVAILLFLKLLRDPIPRYTPLLCVFAFVAGAMHEAASLPLAAGFVTTALAGYRKYIAMPRRRLLLWFAAGVAWCVMSPGILLRATATTTPDDTPLMLIIKSCPVILLTLVAIAGAALSRRGRRAISHLMHGLWPVFVIAAASSIAICAVGGIVGRSGWFGEIYALIALWQLGGAMHLRIPRLAGAVAAIVLSCALTVHCATFAAWQWRMASRADEMRALYIASPDGVIYMPDVVYEDCAPQWLLGKLRGVPDADDAYQIDRFESFYSHDRKPLIIVPDSKADVEAALTHLPATLNSGSILTEHLPQGWSSTQHCNDREKSRIIVVTSPCGREYIATQLTIAGRQLLLLTARIIDPGDR